MPEIGSKTPVLSRSCGDLRIDSLIDVMKDPFLQQ